jgi:hypothetical protein
MGSLDSSDICKQTELETKKKKNESEKDGK